MDAVIFDLDDTLIVEEAAARASMAEALAFAGCPSAGGDPASIDTAVDSALACARQHWYGSPFSAQCRRLGIASWEGLWATFEGCHSCLEGLSDWVRDYRREAWKDILRSFDTDITRSAEVSQR